MNITLSHLALWTLDMERSSKFYQKYFKGTRNSKYINSTKGFASYFVTFNNGISLEIMERTDITAPHTGTQRVGMAHFAFIVGGNDNVQTLTENLRADGYTINSEPRITGDGFYEASVVDPDGNIVEIIE